MATRRNEVPPCIMQGGTVRSCLETWPQSIKKGAHATSVVVAR